MNPNMPARGEDGPGPFLSGGVGLVVQPGDQTAPDISEGVLAWEDRRAGNPAIYVMNLSDGKEWWVGGYGPSQRSPRFTGSTLVYVTGMRTTPPSCAGGSCVFMVNLSGGPSAIWDGYSVFSPATVAGEYFAQVDPMASPGFPRPLHLRYVSNGTRSFAAAADAPDNPPTNGPVGTEGAVFFSLRPYEGICNFTFNEYACANELGILYVENRTLFSLTHSLDVYRSHVTTSWELNCRDFTWEWYPSVAGNIVYWQDNRNSDFDLSDPWCVPKGIRWDILRFRPAYGFDLQTWTEFPAVTSPWNETHPDADGNFLVWSDDRDGNWDIYAMRVDTREEYRLSDHPADQRNPVISAGCVAWEDNRNGDWDIYGTCLAEPSWSDRDASRRGDTGSPREISWRERYLQRAMPQGWSAGMR